MEKRNYKKTSLCVLQIKCVRNKCYLTEGQYSKNDFFTAKPSKIVTNSLLAKITKVTHIIIFFIRTRKGIFFIPQVHLDPKASSKTLVTRSSKLKIKTRMKAREKHKCFYPPK